MALKISEKGLVEEARVEKTSGFKRLDEGALEQVKRTKFRPALKGEQAISSEKKIVFKFELKK